MQRVKIKSIKKIDKLDRYDLTIDSTHNFFANGILIHNTSSISSKILCKKKLNIIEKILVKFGFDINKVFYDNVYSSRKVIKNQFAINKIDDVKWLLQECWQLIKKGKIKKAYGKFKIELNFIIKKKATHFYDEDIWKIANEELSPFIENGMTIYYEIVGYLTNGKMIQKEFDYGCKVGEHKIYIYRITHTNDQGKIYEMSAIQLQEWCISRGLNPVIELYYGYAEDLYLELKTWVGNSISDLELKEWREKLLDKLSNDSVRFFMEQDCPYCTYYKVPFEGIVLRKEKLDIESYKLKCYRFLERETKLLDKGEEDIEENQVESEE